MTKKQVNGIPMYIVDSTSKTNMYINNYVHS